MSQGAQWYVAMGGQQQGPIALPDVLSQISSGRIDRTAYVYGPGLAAWTPIAHVPTFSSAFVSSPATPPPPAPTAPTADVIDYELFGADSQYVVVTLDPGEATLAEASCFFHMDAGIEARTLAAGEGLALAGKLVTAYTNRANDRRRVSFAAPFPGKIVPVDLRQHGGAITCATEAFLCAARGIRISIAQQDGLPDGSGFVLQRLEGDGYAFLCAGGAVVPRPLASGERVRVVPGSFVAAESTVGCAVEPLPGVRSALVAADQAVVNLDGPGRVWLGSLSVDRLARRVLAEGR